MEIMDGAKHHQAICEQLNKTFIVKNEAYGNSFSETYKELGAISALTRITDKYNRCKALILGAENNVADERLEDTLLDIANYCIMTVMEMEDRKV